MLSHLNPLFLQNKHDQSTMKFFLGLLLIFTFHLAAQNPNSVVIEATEQFERSPEVGIPSSKYLINQSINPNTFYSTLLVPGHTFSCFGVGWKSSDLSASPGDFIVEYRSKDVSGNWSEWLSLDADWGPEDTPSQKYWTDALFTIDATSHSALELRLYAPVSCSEIQIDLFDGNTDEKALEDDTQNLPAAPKNSRTNCPEFPSMIPRSNWCGGSAACWQVNAAYNVTNINATHVVMHHGASPNTYTNGEAIVQSYYNYHVNTLGWADIGYNYLIDKYGNFYQGRRNPNLPNSDVRGAHAGASNNTSIGINFLGNLDVTIATTVQLEKLYDLMAWWFDHKAINVLGSSPFQTQAYGVQTKDHFTYHNSINPTSCPGSDMISRMPSIRSEIQQVIDDCNNINNDVTPPTTAVNSNYEWRGTDFWVAFDDQDNAGGSGVEEQYYQVIDFNGTEWRANNSQGFFNDNFDSAIHSEWTIYDGSWDIDNNTLRQSDETTANSNMYSELTQVDDDSYLYSWQMKIQGTGTNRRAGIHFFVDNPTGVHRGNSYLAWWRADDNEFHLYRIENDVLTLAQVVPLAINTGTWYDLKVSYNPSSGKIDVFTDNVLTTSWTDSDPLSAGTHISLRNGDSEVHFNDLKVYKSRTFQEKITVGPQATNESRFESPNSSQEACRINSIVKDGANNWSGFSTKNFYIDWTLPTTSTSTSGTWKTEDFTATFDDQDNTDGSGLTRRFYQVIDNNQGDWRGNPENGFYSDNFDQNSIHSDWELFNGSWNNNNGHLEQTDEGLTNTNIYTYLKQDMSNRYLYNFQFKLDGNGTNKRGGFHYFCDDPEATNRGNSYFIWFRQELQTLEFYRVSNDTFSQEKVYPIEFDENVWMDVKLIYDRITGEHLVYKDDQLIGEWQDDQPIANGDYISFRSGNSNMHINNLKVYRTRLPSATITVGNPQADIRYQNQQPTTFGAKIKSIVHDEAHNLSEIDYHDLKIDWTSPNGLNTIIDGLGADIDTFYTINSIAANWNSATDQHSDVVDYWMSVGTSPGDTDGANWTSLGTTTNNSMNGLNLTPGTQYFVNIRAENGAGIFSDVVSSDGQWLDLTANITEFDSTPFNVFPNPFTNAITIDFGSEKGKFKTRIIGVNGQIVYDQNINFENGVQTIKPIGISKGMYILELTNENNNKQWNVKLIKE